jgi:hypothetical protein
MKVNPFVYGVLVLALFFGLIGGAKATGNWSVSGRMNPSGEKAQPTGANPDEIKGWMTLNDVATAYQVPVAEIVAAFDLPADTSGAAQLKTLESDLFSVMNLRLWLKERSAP